jgi:hypothetical protein
MSPEELNELRKSAAMVTQIGIHNAEICKHPYNGVNNASFALVNLPGLLAHIDQQAAQISVLREELDVLKLGETAANKLILRGRNCEEQVEALKEKLVRERAENLSWQNWSAGGNGFRVYPGWEKMMPAARQQIKAEMPEVDWK